MFNSMYDMGEIYMTDYYNSILNLIEKEVKAINRDDLFREPILAISSPYDEAYSRLKEIIGPWHKNPEELFPSVKSVISYFVPFTKEIAKSPSLSEEVSKGWAEAYIVINEAFDNINSSIEKHLRRDGYESFSIAGTHTYDPSELKSLWSHRSAAVIAGLGDFGINTLVITDKGSGGRFCTVLTEAPIPVTEYKAPCYCLHKKNGSCKLCIKVCPVSAIEIDKVDFFNCHDNILMKNAKMLESSVGFADVCGKCISSCPYAYME